MWYDADWAINGAGSAIPQWQNSTGRTDLPDGYSQREDGVVFGPRGGEYSPTGEQANGVEVYKDANGSYHTFQNGQRQDARSPFDPPNNAVTGLAGEYATTTKMRALGYQPIGNTRDPNSGQDFNSAVGDYQGRQGIDGIYRDANGNYVIVETKATGSGEAGGLGNTKDGQQMSRDWIENRLEKAGLEDDEIEDILEGLDAQDGSVTLVKSNVNNVGSAGVDVNGNPVVPSTDTPTLQVITPNGRKGVTVGGTWPP